MKINSADHDLLTEVLFNHNDGTAVGTVAIAIAGAGFLGPREVGELRAAIAAQARTIEGLRDQLQAAHAAQAAATSARVQAAGALRVPHIAPREDTASPTYLTAARDQAGNIRLNEGRGLLVAEAGVSRNQVQGWFDRADPASRFHAQYRAALELFDREARGLA